MRFTLPPGQLLLLALAVCGSLAYGYRDGQPSRLVEKEINFPLVSDSLSDTPLIDPPKRIAGYFKLNRTHDARMFYFYFQSRSSPQTDPVVLWMTGGPGCSSEIAIFFENGPYSINNDTRTLSETKYGWDKHHNMIFVDQPIGTGFSYSEDSRDTVFDEEVVGNDMLDFLYEFYRAHPEVLDNDFFVTGESYAGHYVPAVSNAIYRANELGTGPLTLPLRGLAIGNGLTHPSLQFPAYADFALDNGLISQGLHDSIQWWMPLCTWGADFCDNHGWRLACVLALQVCQLTSFQRILAANPRINVYDITKTCEGALCYDMSAADAFLNRPSTRRELGVDEGRGWAECDMTVNGNFMGDWLRSYSRLLPALLEDGIRVMVYAGDLDLICNWVGNQRWVDALEWDQSEQWPSVEPVEWRVAAGEQPAGTVRQLGPLSFVRVYQAGHMVPMDQPRAALDLITRFTRGKTLAEEQQQVEQAEAGVLQQGYVKEVVAGARKRQETYRRDKYPEEGVKEAGAGAGDVVKLALGRHGVREQQQQRGGEEVAAA
ncbi:hypothetical protein Agub_g3051 [Astrephomene gubernaculifera]|uniref:Carboxypeptidase n=1 Tax=Astrephomene gubernaculifera TaxID=47775 RepID=A0AAD3DIA1_9CHLO|nr:hypothetical protein Agub_g3051 [Astrephomene gubernaculifera]